MEGRGEAAIFAVVGNEGREGTNIGNRVEGSIRRVEMGGIAGDLIGN